nr:unnamed protein product [Callosobruchus analis]
MWCAEDLLSTSFLKILNTDNILKEYLGSLQPPLSSSDSSDDSPSAWQSVFAVVTDLEVRFYEAAPWSAEAWRAPAEAYPLAAARLVAASSMQGGGQRTTEFGVRCATTRGVVAHRLRTETHRDLAQWARHLVEGAHHSAVQQRELICRCVWKGRPAQLVIHYENGFTLLETTGAGARTLWRYPFDRLQASSDDGKRFLWLDFGPGEDTDVVRNLELDLEGCPKPVVFILHNFLSAKIHRLGLTA